ncbi:MAG: DUF302 domain-containing protein [Halothiobacillus sp.]|jgi:uncharacterized protein (DUF302 family)|uniref:DUF302 domain-containing protein n=1 Tax=Halothiobacillus sp. TaxID=1891311 RepID=UPI002AD375FD|nr:DUF302 domain-containing protein [Halothiobacillus sp.]MDA3876742.1 DUF302 domain-containing protein [Halothiobacillus sp.]
MIFRRVMVLVLALFAGNAWADNGMIVHKSAWSVAETMSRAEQVVKERGFTVFALVDHAKGGASVGEELRPTQLLIFGNPKGGTPFMQCAQTVGIDLPLKILVWQDAAGKVWLGYNDPKWIAKRHKVPHCPAAEKISKGMVGLVEAILKK